MSQYEFIPNDFAKRMFNLAAVSYRSTGLTSLFEEALGEEDARKYVFAQDPLSGGKTEGEIKIIANPEEQNFNKRVACPIGIIRRLTDAEAAKLPSEITDAIKAVKARQPTP